MLKYFAAILIAAALPRLSFAAASSSGMSPSESESYLREVVGEENPGPESVSSDSLSEDYLKVSLLVAGRGKAVYSTFGHAAIRIQCPSEGEDEAYTYEAEVEYLKFLEGRLMAMFMVKSTEDFVKNYYDEGRSVTEYPLNLTPWERLVLRRNLRKDNADGPDGKFNLVKDNCISAALFQIEHCLYNENIAYDLPDNKKVNNGILFRDVLSDSPWLRFACLFFLGTECDKTWPAEQRLEPVEVGPILQKSLIVPSGFHAGRPVAGEETEIVSFPPVTATPSTVTPVLVFGFFLILAIILTVGELTRKWKKSVRIFDVFIFIIQTIVGVFLLYESFIGGFLGIHWNWYLIPFNPFPIIYWLIRGKYETHEHIYFFYALILLIFLIAMPLKTSQADLAGELLVGILFVRCLGLTFKRRYNR